MAREAKVLSQAIACSATLRVAGFVDHNSAESGSIAAEPPYLKQRPSPIQNQSARKRSPSYRRTQASRVAALAASNSSALNGPTRTLNWSRRSNEMTSKISTTTNPIAAYWKARRHADSECQSESPMSSAATSNGEERYGTHRLLI
jgi:hypothetical protein